MKPFFFRSHFGTFSAWCEGRLQTVELATSHADVLGPSQRKHVCHRTLSHTLRSFGCHSVLHLLFLCLFRFFLRSSLSFLFFLSYSVSRRAFFFFVFFRKTKAPRYALRFVVRSTFYPLRPSILYPILSTLHPSTCLLPSPFSVRILRYIRTKLKLLPFSYVSLLCVSPSVFAFLRSFLPFQGEDAWHGTARARTCVSRVMARTVQPCCFLRVPYARLPLPFLPPSSVCLLPFTPSCTGRHVRFLFSLGVWTCCSHESCRPFARGFAGGVGGGGIIGDSLGFLVFLFVLTQGSTISTTFSPEFVGGLLWCSLGSCGVFSNGCRKCPPSAFLVRRSRGSGQVPSPFGSTVKTASRGT